MFKIANLLGCWRNGRHSALRSPPPRSRYVDGRSRPQPAAAKFHAAIDAYLSASGAESPRKVRNFTRWLVFGHDYAARLRSVQRYVLRSYPPPRRAQRRVDTLPRVQAQADWVWFQRMRPGCTRRGLLAWLSVHDAALQRPRRCSGHSPDRQREHRDGGRLPSVGSRVVARDSACDR